MGLAPMAEIIWNKFMTFSPKHPKWINRDRFVLSNGHACMLNYSLLHLFGFDLSLDDLKQFRQLNSKTPGHPERATPPGIEVTTGPLGQGFANSVGIAIAERHLAARFNRKTETESFDLIDNYVYCVCGDGCLEEGMTSEAASLAGHLKLGNLIVIYDDNHISIDGDTACAFDEDVLERFKAYDWQVIWVENGDTDFNSMIDALNQAKLNKDQPTLIKLTTTIGYGSLLQGTGKVHGNPLKPDDIKQLKLKFGFNPDDSFVVPDIVYSYLQEHIDSGNQAAEDWFKLFETYKSTFPELGAEFERRLTGDLPQGWEKSLPRYTPNDKAIASRKLSEIVLQNIHSVLPELIGGSADLTGSNLTRWKEAVDFQPPSTGLGDYSGRYIRYGVREHGMGAILNGLQSYGAIIPYSGTFLNFVSYACGALRLSALSKQQVIWVATHDSIGIGEDGPTHQPVETLAHFRAIPNLQVWRPADGNETSAAYYEAISKRETPSVIALTRQNLRQLEGTSIEKAIKGGYTLVEVESPDLVIVSSGSEVAISVDTAEYLAQEGLKIGVVSLPSWDTFDRQSKEYKFSVLPDDVPIMSFEAMSTLGWGKYSHEQFGLNVFGVSGTYQDVYDHFDFNVEGVSKRIKKVIDYYKGEKLTSPISKVLES